MSHAMCNKHDTECPNCGISVIPDSLICPNCDALLQWFDDATRWCLACQSNRPATVVLNGFAKVPSQISSTTKGLLWLFEQYVSLKGESRFQDGLDQEFCGTPICSVEQEPLLDALLKVSKTVVNEEIAATCFELAHQLVLKKYGSDTILQIKDHEVYIVKLAKGQAAKMLKNETEKLLAALKEKLQ